VIAGALGSMRPPPPPPRSWAARPGSDVAIWTIRMDSGASWTLPPAAHPGSVRTLYFFRGPSLRAGGRAIDSASAVVLRSDVATPLEAGAGPCDVLLLQGRPIGQPVVQYGPFVMNTAAEIQRALRDYQRTGFGGWPWAADDPVHGESEGRFAKHADGRVERAPR
jgi:quercetin 2,3-dioxygenase